MNSDRSLHLVLLNIKLDIPCKKLNLSVEEACEHLLSFSFKAFSVFSNNYMDLLPDIMNKVVKPFINQVSRRSYSNNHRDNWSWRIKPVHIVSDQVSIDSSKRFEQENLKNFITVMRYNVSEFNTESYDIIQISSSML